MKIAYLAPEIPALSATFVYNEILQLEKQGFEIQPFSVHKPKKIISNNADLLNLEQRVISIYSCAKKLVLKDFFYILKNYPTRFFSAFRLLLADIMNASFFSRTSFGLIFRFFYAFHLANNLIQSRCEHIHVHFAHVPTDLAMYAAKLAGISFSVTAHANDLFQRGWLLKEKVDRSCFFVTISEFNKQFLIEHGANESKIKIVRCGVDSQEFNHSIKFKKQNLEIPKLGVVARLIEKKGIDTLIKAVFELKKQAVQVQLYIAGSGDLLETHKELVNSLNLNEHIIFLGAIPHKDIAEFVSSLDIFILPCKKDKSGDMDGIPVVLMEAMLLGIPVISTSISGIPELVIDQETGLLVLPENSQTLALAIKKFLTDSEKKEVIVKNAIEKVKNEFDLTKNTENLANLFKHFVNS